MGRMRLRRSWVSATFGVRGGRMNATHYFERTGIEQSFPPSSESFWTAVFAMFILHLARSEQDVALTVWRPTSQEVPPWYERQPPTRALRVRGLTLDDLVVEPRTVMDIWPDLIKDITLGGVSPDVVLRLSGESRPNRGYALIENKVTSGATLNENQLITYPAIVQRLCDNGLDARLYILQSVGCSQRLYHATKILYGRLGDRFGILLWEEVFRLMERINFSSLGVSPETLRDFAEDAKTDCREWETR